VTGSAIIDQISATGAASASMPPPARATFRELEQVRRSQYERTRRVHRRG
jgi:hypothetical protein